MAAYFTFLDPGDKILGMSLSHGGHLTHGFQTELGSSLECFRWQHWSRQSNV